MVQPKVRKAFPDTAFYPPRHDGWRWPRDGGLTIPTRSLRGAPLLAASLRHARQHGDRVIVRKNLLIRLSSPRFFRQGDLMTVTAIAQNFLANEKKVRVSLEAKGLEIVEGATQELTVPSRGTGTVDFRKSGIRAKLCCSARR
ncbi:MAG: alpha-2-macroglobulin family protein [Bryobacteraceae bacterium]